MNRVRVIGVGPGGSGLLTLDARAAIDAADVVFAAARHMHLTAGALPLEPLSDAPARIRAALDKGERTAVLVSGDPCLFSFLGMLRREFGPERIEVLPGLGAIQALCARMGALWQDAKIVSGHGRALSVSALGHHVRSHARTILFCDRERGADWAARGLLAEGLADVRMCVGERLSCADERLTCGAPAELAEGTFDPLSLIWFENDSPRPGLPGYGIPDDQFIRGNIPMTKREIRVQCMAMLDVHPDSVVWDVGAGTGSVSVECARACPLGQVFAIERKGEGASLIRENARRFHINNLRAIEGTAPDALENLPTSPQVFIGGTSGHLAEILQRIPGGCRVVATAVTLESIAELIRCFGERMDGAEYAQLSASRAEELGHYHLLRGMNPVLIAAGNLRRDRHE